jgi:hypothetical protein
MNTFDAAYARLHNPDGTVNTEELARSCRSANRGQAILRFATLFSLGLLAALLISVL